MPDPQRTAETLYDDEDEYRPEPEPIPQPPAWMDGGLRIGIHTSIAADIAESLDTARKLGCNALQIFSASPRMWGRPGASRISEVDAKRFQKRRGNWAATRSRFSPPARGCGRAGRPGFPRWMPRRFKRGAENCCSGRW